MNNKVWMLVGGICLLGMGIFGGMMIDKNPEVLEIKEENITVITETPKETLVIKNEKGTIGGFLIYPGESIPDEVGVCAENIEQPKMINCVKQIKDKKYETGVGFEMDLSPGNYYVYATYKDTKAYYDEFVICGLKAECKSHTKIPVVVSSGSVQDRILPHDWYDVTPTLTPTATSTIKPAVSIIKINPNIIKLVPSNTPTPTPVQVKVVIPSIKVKLPQW
ncbi:MAG: hypothetical protein WC069_04855 [Candidatus Shapirobacteria bacterium]